MFIGKKGNEVLRAGATIVCKSPFGNGLQFDAVNDDVTFPSSADLIPVFNEDYTFHFVIKTVDPVYPSGGFGLYSPNDRDRNIWGFRFLFLADGTATFDVIKQTPAQSTGKNYTVSLLPNHSYVLTYVKRSNTDWEANDFDFYINGQVQSAVSSLDQFPNQYSFGSTPYINRIGVGTNFRRFNGVMYELKHYAGYAADQAGVDMLLKGDDPSPSHKLIHLNFNYSGDTRTMTDLSGNNRLATINNIPLGTNPFVNSKGGPAR